MKWGNKEGFIANVTPPTRLKHLPGGARIGFWVTIVAILIATLIPRLGPWSQVFGEESILFYGADAYYHLRRLDLLLQSGIVSPAADYFVGHPQGTTNILPPLFYLISALPMLLLGGGSPDTETIQTVAAWLPIGFTLLALWPGYLVSRTLFGRPAALLTIALLALMPALLSRTLLGQFDNNAIEPLILAAQLWLWVWLAQRPSPSAGRTDWAAALLHGLLVLAGLYLWRGSIAFVMLGVISALAICLLQRVQRKSPNTPLWSNLSLGWLIAALLLLLMAVFGAWGTTLTLRFNQLSLLHVMILGGGSTALGLISRHARPLRPRLIWALITMAVAASGGLLLSGGSQGLSLGDYLLKGNGVWGVAEMMPIWGDSEAPDWQPVWHFFGLAGPLALLMIARQGWRQLISTTRPELLLVLLVSAGIMLLALLRVRFLPIAAVPVALWAGSVLSVSVTLFKRGFPAQIVGPLIFTLSVTLSWKPINDLASTAYRYPVTTDLFDALRWLKSRSPNPTAYRTAAPSPGQGVAAQWDYGHWINYLAQKPALATPMGTEVHGMHEHAEIMLAESWQEINRVMAREGLRYLIASRVLDYLPRMAELLGRNQHYHRTVITPSGPMDVPEPAWFRLGITRLLLNDGHPVQLPGQPPVSDLNPPSRLRLIYESAGALPIRLPGIKGPVPRIKIYERVAGARLQGVASPGTESVEITLPLASQWGRRWLWRQQVKVDQAGRFDARLPYATTPSSRSAPIYAQGPYRIRWNNRVSKLDTREQDVTLGNRVTISAAPPQGTALFDSAEATINNGDQTATSRRLP